jgi:hypothetical protein
VAKKGRSSPGFDRGTPQDAAAEAAEANARAEIDRAQERTQVRPGSIGGGRLDWIRVKYGPGENMSSDILIFGQFGRIIDGTLELILHRVPVLTDLPEEMPEVGTLYITKSQILMFGYESSFHAAKTAKDWKESS